jgi:hypothetical protein
MSLDHVDLLDDDPFSGGDRTQDFACFPLLFAGDYLYRIPFFQSLFLHHLFLSRFLYVSPL